MTFGELYSIVKTNKAVRLTSHYGNTTTYFMNKKNVMYDQSNVSMPTLTMGEIDVNDKSEIDTLYGIEIYDTYDYRTGKGY